MKVKVWIKKLAVLRKDRREHKIRRDLTTQAVKLKAREPRGSTAQDGEYCIG